MANFLDVARDIYLRENAGRATESFKAVFTGIAALNDVYAKATIDTDNLEAVFAAFEMAQLFGRLNRFDAPRLASLADAMRELIVETLEQRVGFPIPNRSGQTINVEPPRGYGEFVAGLPKTPADLARISFITFNYDLALDFTLRYHDVPIDYGLQSTRSPGRVLLLKLHGSVNWMACGNCGVAVYDLQEHVRFPKSVAAPLVDNGTWARLRVAEELRRFNHCNDNVKGSGVPLLVPPTWSKAEYHRQLAAVWRTAAQELASARNIVVIGYSLPEADTFFRYLYALGTVSDTRIERFWVVDSDGSGAVAERFQTLLGPTARSRFHHIPEAFERAVYGSGAAAAFRAFVQQLGEWRD